MWGNPQKQIYRCTQCTGISTCSLQTCRHALHLVLHYTHTPLYSPIHPSSLPSDLHVSVSQQTAAETLVHVQLANWVSLFYCINDFVGGCYPPVDTHTQGERRPHSCFPSKHYICSHCFYRRQEGILQYGLLLCVFSVKQRHVSCLSVLLCCDVLEKKNTERNREKLHRNVECEDEPESEGGPG